MAGRPEHTATWRVLEAAMGVYRTARGAGYTALDQLQDVTERPSHGEGEAEVVFDALPVIRRHFEPEDVSRTERDEAAVEGPSLQVLSPSGDECPSESSDDYMTYESVRRNYKCCKKVKKRYWLFGTLCCVIVLAILAPAVTKLVRSCPAPVTPPPQSPWLPWRNRTGDNGLPRVLLWDTAVPVLPPSKGDTTDDGKHKLLFNTTVECKVNGTRDPKVCEITDNRRRLMTSDAVVFQADYLGQTDLPAQRTIPQMWVIWVTRRPLPVAKLTGVHPSLLRAFLPGFFNWTMSKRADADIVLPHNTFYCDARGGKQQANYTDKFDDAVALPVKEDVAWILDECEQMRFETKINILRGGKQQSANTNGVVRISIFPSCGMALCGSPAKCVRYIAERYHFILISLTPACFQTVYELIYQAFEYDLVPVVLMPSKGSLKVPPNSVITSAKLQRNGQLAKYLRTVLTKPAKYRSYFAWKQRCSVRLPGADICALCRAMWETPMRERQYPRILEWWQRPALCENEPLYGLDPSFVQVR